MESLWSFVHASPTAERLLELDLWPRIPTKPTMDFAMDLMATVHMLILECQSSQRDISGFMKAIAVQQTKVLCRICSPSTYP